VSTYTQNNSLRSILPPHILKAIALKSQDVTQRNRAIHTLSLDHTHRSSRLIRSQHRLHLPHEQTLVTSSTQVHRTIYDAHGTMDLPGSIVRTEGSNPVGDPVVNEAYDGLGWTHALYLEIYRRNSIDNEGLPLLATVHYGTDYDNAFWDGTRMIFGDGDNDLFNRFTTAIDVIGHELTHGVTEYEANLLYSGQSGALNESISDVFGSIIKQYALKQRVDQADWLIGAGLFTAKVHGRALRDMANPGQAYNDPLLGKDPQPDHMDHYDHTLEDTGGVHINSGIPNRAFCLTATALGGYSWERAGYIWYETLCDPRLRPTAQFSDFAKLTLENAEKLYRYGSPEWTAVREAWDRVGVPIPVPAMGGR
jgi:Zn-dependent metalloprotease